MSFWDGFMKQAWLTTGAGKGVTERAGTSDSFREAFVGDETSASKDATTFWDGERNPRSYKPFDPGTPIFDAEDGSHVRY